MAPLTNFIMEDYHCEDINPQIIKLHKKKNCELPSLVNTYICVL